MLIILLHLLVLLVSMLLLQHLLHLRLVHLLLPGHLLDHAEPVLPHHGAVRVFAAFYVVVDPFDFELVGMNLRLIILQFSYHFFELF